MFMVFAGPWYKKLYYKKSRVSNPTFLNELRDSGNTSFPPRVDFMFFVDCLMNLKVLGKKNKKFSSNCVLFTKSFGFFMFMALAGP